MTAEIARGYELGVGHDAEPSRRLADLTRRARHAVARHMPGIQRSASMQASLREAAVIARERARAFDPRLARERAAFDAGGIQQRWIA